MHKTLIPYLYDLEDELVKKHGKPRNIIIVITGLSATGKGTHAKALQEFLEKKHNLKLKIHEGGTIFRKLAKEHGFSEKELNKFSKKLAEDIELGEKVDKKIDEEVLRTAFEEGGIFVGRLTFATIGDWGFKINLIVDPNIAAGRIANDPSRAEYKMDTEEVLKNLRERDKYDIEKYEKTYRMSYKKLLETCDVTIDNSGSLEDAKKKIQEAVEKWLNE